MRKGMPTKTRRRNQSAKEPLAPMNSAESLMRRFDYLSPTEARVIAETVPLRGTVEWDKREVMRRGIGCRLLSFGSLEHAEWPGGSYRGRSS